MRRAHLPNAAATSRFHFRKFVAPICNPSASASASASASPNGKGASGVASWPSPSPCGASAASPATTTATDDSTPPAPPPPPAAAAERFEEMTMDEIFNGKDTYFPGLVPLVYAYLDYVRCDTTTFKRIDEYLQFIVKRARGELVTPATWMRAFVTGHPKYQRDSVVSPEIAHDLMVQCGPFLRIQSISFISSISPILPISPISPILNTHSQPAHPARPSHPAHPSHPPTLPTSLTLPTHTLSVQVACDEIGTGVRPCPEVLGDATIKHVRGEDAYGHVSRAQKPSPRSSLFKCDSR